MTVNLNGDFSQWTLGSTFAACASGQMLADCWRLHDTSAAVHTVRRSTDVPAFGLCGRVLPYSMEIEVTTADASVGSTDVTALIYRGEGSELCYLAGAPMRVRGWFKGVAGTYNLHLSNGSETLSYSQPLIFTVSDMWTRFDVWFPAVPDFDTDWYIDNRVGYTLALALCAGSGVYDEMEKWVTGLKFGAAPTNFNATAGNKIKIAGIRVGGGDLFCEAAEATERDCMRYLEKSFDRSTTPGSSVGWSTGELVGYALFGGAANLALPIVRFQSPKRKVPSMIGYNPAAAGSQIRTLTHGDATATTFGAVTTNGFVASATMPAATTQGEQFGLHWVADASLPALTQSIGG